METSVDTIIRQTAKSASGTKAFTSKPKDQHSRQVFLAFAIGATIVYGIAMFYCIATGHKLEFTLLIGAYFVIAAIAYRFYRSF
jgi:hypothetical protein